jgi:integrase
MHPANYGKTYPADPLTREDIERLLAACGRGAAGVRNRALIVLLWRSGLRISEALALYPRDVNIDAGTITVLHGKGDRRRTVGIAGPVAEVELWLELRRQRGLTRAPLFCTITRPGAGRPLSSAYVREAFKALAIRSGVGRRVHPHGFRHTLAAELAMEGVPVHVIRRQLGHSSLATTARYIDHLSPMDVISAMQRRADAVSEAGHELSH